MSKKIELLTKQVAADRLNLSVRRLMELAAEGKFTRHRAYDPETKREAIMFDAAEIQAIADRKEYNVPASSTAVAVRPRVVEVDGEPAAPAVLRPWLTLAEAADYSGLPATILFGLIQTGELRARDVGVRPGGRWRIRKLDLDAIEGIFAVSSR